MPKSKFLKSTFILLIGGCLTRILGFIIKIYYTRILTNDGISLYALVAPTYSLLMTITNFNILNAVSKRISESKRSLKTIINATYLIIIANIIVISLTLLLSKPISYNLLKNKETYLPLIACILTLPFISIGYIIKGYFYGHQNVLPHMISNTIEQLIRLIIIIKILPYFTKYGYIITTTIFILISILNESFSIIILFLFLPKKFKITKKDLYFDKYETNKILNLTIPQVGGRLLGNIGYFLEPILLTNILLLKGENLTYIVTSYGAYNSYTIGTLLFPSFFIGAISNALLPELSKLIEQKKYKLIKKRIKSSLIISFIIGSLCTTIIYISKDFLFLKLYNTTLGINYLTILSPFFLLFYLEGPLNSILFSLNKIKSCTIISTTGIFLKIILMSIFCFLNLKIYSLIIAEIFNILYITILESLLVKKKLKSFK